MIDEEQIYIVVDIETDGPVAGLFSMLSIGAVATTADKEMGSFYKKLSPLPEMSQYQPTMDWWATQPEAWQEATSDALPAEQVIAEFRAWVASFNRVPVFVAHPVGFDYPFMCWYLWKFGEENPFTTPTAAHRTLDIPSYVSGKFGRTLARSTRPHLPEELYKNTEGHNHKAIDDARGYADLVRAMLQAQGRQVAAEVQAV